MGDWQFYGTADAPMGTLSKPPRYGLRGGRARNVVSSETLGGLVRSETRGPDRRTLVLDWRRILPADVAILDAIHATYGGNAAPFRVQLPDGVLPGVVGGPVLRVRWPERHFQPTWIAHERYDASLELIEDLATSLVLSGTITLANAHLSMIDGTAFVDLSGVDLSSYAAGKHYLVLSDSAGRRLAGWLKAAGTGETYGSNLVTNGGFDSATSPWSPSDCTLASVAGGEAGNCLHMTRVSNTYQTAGQLVTGLTAYRLYLLSAYTKSGTSGGEAFSVGVEAGLAAAGVSSGSWVASFVYMLAAATEWTIHLRKNTATDGTMLFDSVNVRQVLTPSSTGATVVSTRDGTTYDWAYEDTSFNPLDPSGYHYAVYSY